jgi:tRNA-dihydrouridine synthase
MRAHPEGKMKLLRDLLYSDKAPSDERPIVAQLFSARPEYMKGAVKLVAELGYDGIDINMGCPDKSIEKQGCGAAMMKNPEAAQAVIRAAKEGAEEAWNEMKEKGTLPPNQTAGPIPVSVKTRIGYNKNELATWLPAILEAEPAVVTIHCRTRKEMSKVAARWEHIEEAKKIRDEFFIKKESTGEYKKGDPLPLILGNGDAVSISDAVSRATTHNADGVMLGRAIFGNPWLFKGINEHDFKHDPTGYKQYEPSVSEKLKVMVEHTKLFEELLGDIKSFAIMKKHYKAYVNNFDGAKELREELMNAANAGEVEQKIEDFLMKSSSF